MGEYIDIAPTDPLRAHTRTYLVYCESSGCILVEAVMEIGIFPCTARTLFYVRGKIPISITASTKILPLGLHKHSNRYVYCALREVRAGQYLQCLDPGAVEGITLRLLCEIL